MTTMHGPVKARAVVGKKIASITQHRRKGSGRMFNDFRHLRLEDGTVLYPVVVELDDGYGIELRMHEPTDLRVAANPNTPPETLHMLAAEHRRDVRAGPRHGAVCETRT